MNEDQNSSKTSNGYITRALRVLYSLVEAVDPKIHVLWADHNLKISVHGCNSVDSLQIIVADKQNQNLNRDISK